MDRADLPKMVPHTAAKHQLLRRYLGAWFPILGSKYPRLNYIDGFAGPGEYHSGEPGSPLIALETAHGHVNSGKLSPTVEVNFIFVESKPEHADHLEAQIKKRPCPPQFKIEIARGEFADVMGGVLDRMDREGKRLAPTFAFVDPFGFSGIPLDLMGRILSHKSCEVYVNIMIEFMNRFLEHPNDRVVSHIPTTFGTNEVLDIPNRPGNRIDALLTLYRRQLETKADYVGKFDMHGKKDQKTYSLFFASNDPKGFFKMKEANWSVDKGEGGKFSDFEPGAADQTSLMWSTVLWDELSDRFAKTTVPMAELERFVIEETDYLPKHLRSVLTGKEKSGEIVVEPVEGYKRRKGDFPVDKVNVHFL